MRRALFSLIVANVLLLAALVWLVVARPVVVQSTEAAALAAPPIQYLMLGPSDFTPFHGGYAYESGGVWLGPTSTISQSFLAPVHLPQGATIVSMKSRWRDTDASGNLSVGLGYSAYPDEPTGYQYMGQAGSSGSSGDGTTETTNISGNPIDNATRRYNVVVFFPDGMGLAGRLYYVRIGYTVSTSFLPLVSKEGQ